MPGYDQRDPADENDQVAEGLGMWRPLGRRWIVCRGHVDRAAPSDAMPYLGLKVAEQELWADAVRASFRARP